MGLLRLYREADKPPFSERDMFVLEQLHKHFAYRLVYEAKKGDTRYFFAKGYHEKLCRQYGLTSREGEMLDLAVHGLSNEDIAQKMNISIHTVKKTFPQYLHQDERTESGANAPKPPNVHKQD